MVYVAVRMRRVWTLLVVLDGLRWPVASSALAHPERSTEFPDASKGSVPKYRPHEPAADRLQARLGKRACARSSRAAPGQRRSASACARSRSAASATSSRRSTGPRATTASRSCRASTARSPAAGSRSTRPKCAAMFETPDDGDAQVATYEHQVKCPNARNLIAVIGDSLADPDRECDQKCNLLIEGMGRRPEGRPDRGRPAEEGRHPRRPRRRLLPAQRVGRAGRVQRRRRRRDQRLPPAPARHAVRPELRRPHLRLRPRPLRAHRGVRQRRLRHLPRLGPGGPLPALRDRDPPRQLAPQRARLLGHGGQRHLDPQLEASTTTTPASPTTRSPPATRACRRTARSGPPTRSTRTTRTTSPTTATPTARTRRSRSAARTIVCPQFQVPVGLRLHPLRRQRRT